MTEIITVPLALMRATAIDWHIDVRGQSAGAGNDGSTQVVFNRFPRWTGAPKLLLRGGLMAAWRAVIWQLEGRANVLRVPMIDPAGILPRREGIPFATGQRFATGQGFAWSPFVLAPEGAAAGSDSLLVDPATTEEELRPGMILSHDDWPMGVTFVAPEGGLLRLGLRPKLRRAIPAGAQVSLAASGLFTLEDDLSGALSYEKAMLARPVLNLVEWLARP